MRTKKGAIVLVVAGFFFTSCNWWASKLTVDTASKPKTHVQKTSAELIVKK